MNVLITGGCGFIGSNLVKFLRRERPAWKIVNLDKLTYAGNLDNLKELEGDPSYEFVRGDVGNLELVEHLIVRHRIDAVMHLAAESHVDRSIRGPERFIESNVLGTQRLLEASWHAGVSRFLMVSTDEVYGSLEATDAFSEASPLRPSSPYSASKASGDLLALAYHRTFKLDVVVTRSSNNYGPYQFPEKLIPLMIIQALHDEPLPVYGDGNHVRDWLHVDDHCRALLDALEKGSAGAVYNIGVGAERKNIDVVKAVLALLGKPESLITFVEDRPGHDRRYAIDASKAKGELGWMPERTFEEGLRETVAWYVENQTWWERVLSGAYRNDAQQ